LGYHREPPSAASRQLKNLNLIPILKKKPRRREMKEKVKAGEISTLYFFLVFIL